MHSVVLLLTATTVFVTAWLYHSSRTAISRHGRPLPIPPGTLPFFGNGLQFLQSRQKLFHWFTACERQFGFDTFAISVPTLPPGIVINDPRNLEFVLKRDDLFTKGHFFRERSKDLFGDGIINADGPAWKIQRKAALKIFSNPNLKKLVDDVFPSYLADTKSLLLRASLEKRVVNLQDVFMEFSTRVMGTFAYNAFDFASGATGERFQNPLWKLTEIFLGTQFRESVREVKAFGQAMVKSAMLDAEKPKNNATSDGDLISSLLSEIKDPEAVSDAALNFLSAGKDTIAQSLTWTFYLLMRNPPAISPILSELSSLTSCPSPTRWSQCKIQSLNLTFDTLSNLLPHTLATFTESLRLFPPVPFEIKQCISQTPTTLPDGTILPNGGVIVWCTWAMNRSRHIWGQDADIFRPGRFLVNHDDIDRRETPNNKNVLEPTTLKFQSKTAFEFPVFNGGPRSCLGKKMAELQAVYVIAELVNMFEFEEVGDQDNVAGDDHDESVWVSRTKNLPERVSMNSLTLPMKGGLPCRVYVRGEEAHGRGHGTTD